MRVPIAVIGGSGFIGRHFVSSLIASGFEDIRVLVRNTDISWPEVERISGALEDRPALAALIGPGSVVVNLARPPGTGGYDALVSGLIDVCRDRRARRLVQCSSIDVYGGTSEVSITPKTVPVPDSAYAAAHCEAERLVKDAGSDMETAILRPGAVFGEGGRNLVEIATRTARDAGWHLAIRRILQGRRRMHLVAVENVIAALRHIVLCDDAPDPFVITDDEVPGNEFGHVQNVMAAEFGRSVLALAPPVPPELLDLACRLRGRSGMRSCRRFDVPLPAGFRKPVRFEERLASYARWLSQNLGAAA